MYICVCKYRTQIKPFLKYFLVMYNVSIVMFTLCQQLMYVNSHRTNVVDIMTLLAL